MKEEIRKALERHGEADSLKEIMRTSYCIELQCVDWLKWQNDRIEQLEEALNQIKYMPSTPPMIRALADKALKGGDNL